MVIETLFFHLSTAFVHAIRPGQHGMQVCTSHATIPTARYFHFDAETSPTCRHSVLGELWLTAKSTTEERCAKSASPQRSQLS